jgi:hypothetical protein
MDRKITDLRRRSQSFVLPRDLRMLSEMGDVDTVLHGCCARCGKNLIKDDEPQVHWSDYWWITIWHHDEEDHWLLCEKCKDAMYSVLRKEKKEG